MITLTNPDQKSNPLLAGTEEYRIVFPATGVSHIAEFCCKAHVADWPGGAQVELGYLAMDNFTKGADGDFDPATFATFIPFRDCEGNPLIVTKNGMLPVIAPRSGVVVMKATSMPSCHFALSPQQETRREHSVWLPM